MNIQEICRSTPDPDKALLGISSFKEKNPDIFYALTEQEKLLTALLFSYSQFLCAFSINRPHILHECLNKINNTVDYKLIADEISKHQMQQLKDSPKKADMSDILRHLKKKLLLLITLRYIYRKTDIRESMTELSALADLLIDMAYEHVLEKLTLKHGSVANGSFSIISLGKLGAQELNYSSDVDIICLYSQDAEQTSGALSANGIRTGRISAHEFYCKLVSELNRLLNSNTANGFVYRVDLRLRPNGQRGELALPINSYELYYESWGREWERLALLRARHCAGDELLSKEFLNTIQPFVYRKNIDMRSIEEIRKLKIKIDAAHKDNDIKRGYGGIREIEFFTQALQLIYGAKEPLLKQRSTLIVLHQLQQKNIIGFDDYSILSSSYLYLRELEHILQMANDLQTYIVPSDKEKLAILAKKMGFKTSEDFQKDLQYRRLMVKQKFTSLFQMAREEQHKEPSALTDMTEDELLDLLRQKQVKTPEKLLYLINKTVNSMRDFQTIKNRKLQERVISEFVNRTLELKEPEPALKNLLRFIEIIKTKEMYLEVFDSQRELMSAFVEVFSSSSFLSNILIGSNLYIDIFAHGTVIRKTLKTKKEEVTRMIDKNAASSEPFTIYRKSEDIRLGMLFLNKRITIGNLMKGLSKTAEAIILSALEQIDKASNLLLLGFGKLGGREITIGSDLDITFISSQEANEEDMKTAERLIRRLTSYTKEGVAYKIDTRLRPDGSKGPLVNTIRGLREYYMESAHTWEIQALTRARPITGLKSNRTKITALIQEIIINRSKDLTAAQMRSMRAKIKKERSIVKGSLDIKLSDGAIEDIEFLVQYLQVKHLDTLRSIFTQNTQSALRKLNRYGILSSQEVSTLTESYLFYRNIETFLRLKGLKSISSEPFIEEAIGNFLGYETGSGFIADLQTRMTACSNIIDKRL
ncbi:Glutamate-ammonia ligase adenylyltransferase [Candidatus Magnetoovum chiemensis]|nr:Glutamate-ammonia ligase adenylyltransferase [Candidatus Magnetoovum chiemensis]